MSYLIHAVLINKSIPFEDALKTFHNIINNDKKSFYRETKNTYRFRNIPKQKFDKTTFRTKKIRGQPISIVFGQLLPEYEYLADKEQLKGSGIFDIIKKGITRVKDVFNPSSKYNNISTETLKKYGNTIIKSLTVYRTPIQETINIALNLFTLGQWEKAKKKYGYDKLFHLALVADIGGKNIIIEKNEVVNISTEYKVDTLTETYPVSLGGQKITIFDLLEKTRNTIGDKQFFTYDALYNNCQDFLINILKTWGLNSKNVIEFIKQPIGQLISELPPYTHTLTKLITDTGAIFSRIIGKGNE
jgi:hypothetical protein